MKNLSFRKKFLFVPVIIIGFCMMFASISFAQTTSATTSTIGYFYSASGQMTDAESNTGAMSSYLTRGERYDGSSETFAVSNIKDITADLDSNGNIINKYTYTAYGIPTSYSSSTSHEPRATSHQLSIAENPFTYSDYYTDTESGNYYLNARYYDPTLGIFLTSDTYNLPNRYMYVNGNPVMGTDPTGHNIFGMNKFLEVTKKYTSSDRNHHVFVDLDKTLVRKLKHSSSESVFSLESDIYKNLYEGYEFHSKFSQRDTSYVAYNEKLCEKLGDLHRQGYKIHVLSTGGWLEGARMFFEDKIMKLSRNYDFRFESFTSARYSTRIGMETGMNWANGFLPSVFSAFNKLIFLRKFSREYNRIPSNRLYVVLLDDQWYNRMWFNFQKGGYSDPMYKKNHLKRAFAGFYLKNYVR